MAPKKGVSKNLAAGRPPMATRPKKKGVVKNLAAGRPPTVTKPKSLARKTTKSIINKLHLLEKRKVQAMKKNDNAQVAAIEAEIEALGGIEKYQEASLQGQRHDRGGDSSNVLMEWVGPYLSSEEYKEGRLRMLEVGALSTKNACAQSNHFDITRIDLNSQEPGILEQDFMERPLPKDESEKFDIISLSLVLNFVPDHKDRGKMLVRTTQFLTSPKRFSGTTAAFFPSLFLVLPAPCVTNSRYLDQERLAAIMESIGYEMVESKTTQRLVYYLWRRTSDQVGNDRPFRKEEIRSGSSRNNFAITLV
ncbi:putative methyltransferase domain-containing protein [Neurospora intermedia]|uniref:25S rRNA adenine-N(1) methyltransferase n=1 Tax=Neurospora intermedia TaxID=5142 RepID=A0ABR3DLY0_NEUIN